MDTLMVAGDAEGDLGRTRRKIDAPIIGASIERLCERRFEQPRIARRAAAVAGAGVLDPQRGDPGRRQAFGPGPARAVRAHRLPAELREQDDPGPRRRGRPVSVVEQPEDLVGGRVEIQRKGLGDRAHRA